MVFLKREAEREWVSSGPLSVPSREMSLTEPVGEIWDTNERLQPPIPHEIWAKWIYYAPFSIWTWKQINKTIVVLKLFHYTSGER